MPNLKSEDFAFTYSLRGYELNENEKSLVGKEMRVRVSSRKFETSDWSWERDLKREFNQDLQGLETLHCVGLLLPKFTDNDAMESAIASDDDEDEEYEPTPKRGKYTGRAAKLTQKKGDSVLAKLKRASGPGDEGIEKNNRSSIPVAAIYRKNWRYYALAVCDDFKKPILRGEIIKGSKVFFFHPYRHERADLAVHRHAKWRRVMEKSLGIKPVPTAEPVLESPEDNMLVNDDMGAFLASSDAANDAKSQEKMKKHQLILNKRIQQAESKRLESERGSDLELEPLSNKRAKRFGLPVDTSPVSSPDISNGVNYNIEIEKLGADENPADEKPVAVKYSSVDKYLADEYSGVEKVKSSIKSFNSASSISSPAANNTSKSTIDIEGPVVDGVQSSVKLHTNNMVDHGTAFNRQQADRTMLGNNPASSFTFPDVSNAFSTIDANTNDRSTQSDYGASRCGRETPGSMLSIISEWEKLVADNTRLRQRGLDDADTIQSLKRKEIDHAKSVRLSKKLKADNDTWRERNAELQSALNEMVDYDAIKKENTELKRELNEKSERLAEWDAMAIKMAPRK
ncbi:hypothetical protein J7T55_008788 [Diaporthe amygdali]|uniref:uncharacterized protein n=1 Tax=Phomopsis amygdali TaxID=1214568 RepID=UPI0022FF420B|nr:uncharacterized protein J7T55_008788 [Diaporthe amygdali]KAJ0121622.1 hypothetical protein J7T55_008788 [Diaporthe amygdali]